ncbi:uncharacterized protein [Antedon mediterranea]|uniref:uncharacterized protein n=1 Tax=Antedon mediterranea TaxID=105859 RepID=UPI003AF46AD6
MNGEEDVVTDVKQTLENQNLCEVGEADVCEDVSLNCGQNQLRKRRTTTEDFDVDITVTSPGSEDVGDARNDVTSATESISNLVDQDGLSVNLDGEAYTATGYRTSEFAILCPSGHITISSMCAACPAGTSYSNNGCSYCDANYYQDSSAQTDCHACNSGAISDEGSYRADQCVKAEKLEDNSWSTELIVVVAVACSLVFLFLVLVPIACCCCYSCCEERDYEKSLPHSSRSHLNRAYDDELDVIDANMFDSTEHYNDMDHPSYQSLHTNGRMIRIPTISKGTDKSDYEMNISNGNGHAYINSDDIPPTPTAVPPPPPVELGNGFGPHTPPPPPPPPPALNINGNNSNVYSHEPVRVRATLKGSVKTNGSLTRV